MDPPAGAVDLPAVFRNCWRPTLQRERREIGQSRDSHSRWMSRQLLFMVGFVIITLLKLEPMARNSVPTPTHNNMPASSSCTFCEILNEPELVVAGTGGNTCGSIKLMAAREINGSAICATLQKDKRLCCPVVYENERAEHEPNVLFRTYGTDDYAWTKARIVREALDTRWFTSVKSMGPEDLTVGFREAFKDILKQPRGGGYWIWKYDVIEQAMETMNEGDFLVYLDAGSKINKDGEERFKEYLKIVNESKYDMLCLQLNTPDLIEHKYTTDRIFRVFNISVEDPIRRSAQFVGGILVIQKGPHLRSWLTMVRDALLSDPWIITDKYNNEAKAFDGAFIDNRHDQSVSSVSRKIHGCEMLTDESYPFNPSFPFYAARMKKDKKRLVDAGHQRAVERIHSKRLPLPSSSSVLGGATTRCTFCEGEKVIPNLDLVVPKTGGHTCRSIKKMAAREINGSAICATLQKEERLCCPVVYENERAEHEPNVLFRTYGTDDYAWTKARIVREALDTRWFTSVKSMGPEDLTVGFREAFKDILKQPRGGGYWIWKYDVIEQAMETMNEGDFLVYLDAGSKINKDGEERFKEYLKIVNESKYDMLCLQLNTPDLIEHKYTTDRIFRVFNISVEDPIRRSAQFVGGILVIQKGPHLRSWLTMVRDALLSDPWIITDKYNNEAKAFDGAFIDNRHDQSVSSVSRKIHGCEMLTDESYPFNPSFPFYAARMKKDKKRLVDAGHQRAVERIHSKRLPLPSSSSVLGGATTRCTFCEGEKVIPNLDLVVPKTGGHTCRSIKKMAAREINGSAICATLQKEERLCCPVVYDL